MLDQSNRPIGVQTPFGENALVLLSFTGEEHLSRLFSFELQMLSEQEGLDPKQIVGKRVGFYVNRADSQPRYFNGFVSRFVYSGANDRGHFYSATVVPWLWFLQRTSDCRIFQDLSVPEILEQTFKDSGFTDFDPKLSGSHPTRKYCVQYRESDFQFVSRLMEEEGIFYYFEHSKDKHKLILGDDANAYQTCAEPKAQLLANLSQAEITDQISSWSHCYEFQSGKWSHTDYNFETPDTDLTTKTNSLVSVGENSKFEVYDFPGLYGEKGDGDELVRLRIGELEQEYDTVIGDGHIRSFSPGATFTLEKHHSKVEAGKKYVLVSVQHQATLGGAYYSTRSVSSGPTYRNSFRCIPDKISYRPPRITPRAMIRGIQTALVVGPPGEEIFTDEYGRVKCQFYWDREGKKDDNSSCWIRVSTPWSGKNWGMIHIPRIGDEVVVSFLDGNPDRPLITGMVYNADRMPPWDLPDNKTQSGIMTCSTLDGNPTRNCNVIRFEDRKDDEQIYVHAEKNLDVEVENNETRKVGFDTMKPGDQTIEIYNDQKLTVGVGSGSGSQTIDIQQDRNTTLELGHDTLDIKSGNRATTLDMGNDSLVLKMGNRDAQLDLGNDNLVLKMGNQTTKLNLGKSTTEALQAIELKVGQSVIKIDQMGVTISGMMLKFEGTLMTEVKGMMTDVKGTAMLTAGGGITMIN